MLLSKKFKWLFTFSLVAVLVMNVTTACNNATSSNQAAQPAGNTEQKTLTMGTSPDYPPYEYKDTASGSSEVIGFDVDIAKHITKELGYNLEIKESDFNGLIPSLQANRVDFVMAGMTPTEERKKNVDFSEIYYEAKNTIVTQKGKNYTKLEDLAGRKVGVQLGSTQEKTLKDAAEKIQGITPVTRNRIPELIQEIKAGRIEAAIIEDTVAKGYTQNNTDLVFNTIPNNPGEAGSAIAFPKGSELVDDFNREINEMKQSGELERLARKWFEKQ